MSAKTAKTAEAPLKVTAADIIRVHRVKADAAVVTFAAVCCVLTVAANVLAAT